MKYFICFIVYICTFAYAQKNQDYKAYDPWYTGPLITPSASCLKPGHANYQPYLFYFNTHPLNIKNQIRSTKPDTTSVQITNIVQYGLLDFLDVTFTFQTTYNHKDKEKAFGYGDLNCAFGIQLLRQQENTFIPSIRLIIGESFPTGKYNQLDPKKNSLDNFGSGAFKTMLSLNLSKIVFWMKKHPISFRLTNSMRIPSKVIVKDFNAYGGGYNTRGKASPHYGFSSRFSFELSFTQRWVYAMDFEYNYASKTKFTGNPGTNPDGSVASCGGKYFQTFSIATALEYLFTENLGIISGVYFTQYAKNTSSFIGYSFSFTYTF